jgi:hypothetical protein
MFQYSDARNSRQVPGICKLNFIEQEEIKILILILGTDEI